MAEKQPKTRQADGKKGKKKSIWKRVLFWLLIVVLALGLIGVGTFLYLYQTTDLPDPNDDFQTNTTFVYYAGGEEQLGSLSIQNRVTLDYEDIPDVVKDSTIAAENRSFWTDPGISIPGIARAAYSIASGGEMQGGSTITQQYIKILYLDSAQTLSRKVRELMLAIKMDQELAKEEILAGYVNTIYYGRGAYGIEAAARSYFLKPSSELTISEAAALAAILNNPAGFNPSGDAENIERLEARYQYVLDGMLEMGSVTQEEYDEASASLPEFPDVPINDRYGGPEGYLMKMVEAELGQRGFPEEQVQGGGLRITTTIDKRLQDRAVEVAQQYTQEAAENGDEEATPEDLHIALSSVDTATGGILAMYGGPDYVESSRNWATTPRAAASTYKTFAVIAALRQGFGLNAPLNGNTFTPQGDSRPINNQGSQQYGTVTLRQALANSINTAFVDLTDEMDQGPQAIAQAAADAGAGEPPEDQIHNRLPLGFTEVSPLDVANSYATLANGGQRNETHIVESVEDRDGNVLYEAEPEGEQTIEANIAALTTDALTSVVNEGTGRGVRELERPVAGKTGTNGVEDAITSAWFVGYTKQISTSVMYVAGDGAGDLVPYRQPGDRTFYGSGYPLRTWLDYMTTAMDGLPVEEFDEASTPAPSRRPERPQQNGTPDSDPTTTAPAPSPRPTSEPPGEEPTSEEPTEEPTSEEPPPPSEEPTTEEPSDGITVTNRPSPPPEDPDPTGPPNEGGDGNGQGGNDNSGDSGRDSGGEAARDPNRRE